MENEMGGVLSLEPEGIEKRIHPRALGHFRRFQADVRLAVPLEEITEADLNGYLRDDEKSEFQRHMNKIKDGLRTCMGIGEGDLFDNQIKLSLFALNTIMPEFSIKQLLERVYDRKVKSIREEQKKKDEEERQQAEKAKEEKKRREEQAEAERREKEEEERWRAARKVVNPPTDDAKRYLDRSGEYDKFIQAAPLKL